MDKIVKATPGIETGAASAASVASGPNYLSDRPRSKTFTLDEPFELGGVEYWEITARRLNGAAFLPQLGEVGRQDGRGDDRGARGHGPDLAAPDGRDKADLGLGGGCGRKAGSHLSSPAL